MQMKRDMEMEQIKTLIFLTSFIILRFRLEYSRYEN